jgi:hypothetical protein
MRYIPLLISLAILSASPALPQEGAKQEKTVATVPKEAQDSLRQTVDKIARSYKLIDETKKEWPFKISSMERGKVDPEVWGKDRREMFCIVIDPMIPTYTDWKIGNFLVYREQGALWVAEESDKDTFLRLSCKNFKDPGSK